jgi:RNA polymerase sigma factor (sigma-70 family)
MGPSNDRRVRAVTLSPNQKFQQFVLPHLDSAYNLALWLTGDSAAAEHVVQNAVLGGLHESGASRAGASRIWLLRLVRNTAYGFLEQQGRAAIRLMPVGIPGATEAPDLPNGRPDRVPNRETIVAMPRDTVRLQTALDALPTELRECLVLREQERLNYKEIALITQVPISTVMSRLWRAHHVLLPIAARPASGRLLGATATP